jgi:hypothetical protein
MSGTIQLVRKSDQDEKDTKKRYIAKIGNRLNLCILTKLLYMSFPHPQIMKVL